MRATGALAAECHLLHNAVRFDRPDGVADRLVELAGLIDGPWAGTCADHAVALISQDPHELERVDAHLEGHLLRLYAKLGVTRREDLANHRAPLP